jgi:cytochrome c biogenesis protein CcdA
MSGLVLGAASAIWLGILTSISPCPLATNITAVAFVARGVGNPGKVFLTGLLYTLGRTLTYVTLGVLLVSSLVSAPFVSHFLQKYMNQLLGPVLVFVGLVLLELIRFPLPEVGAGAQMQERVRSLGIWGAVPLGVVFALSFCPVSAALFFGSLIPAALRYESGVVLPTLYGIGTAVPVLIFAVLIAWGTKAMGQAYNKLAALEKWARRITGGIFILVGIYYCLVHLLGLSW